MTGRVKTKGGIHTFTRDNENEQGKLFNFHIVDNSGGIGVLVLDELCEAIFEKVIEGNAYRISLFKVISCKPKYDKVPREFKFKSQRYTS